MMARISCSRTSKLTSLRAFTPPNASETPSIARRTSPILREAFWRSSSRRSIASRRLSPAHGGKGLRRGEGQLGADHAGAPVLEAHLRLDHAALRARIERVDHRRVLLADVAAAHLARARELAVVRIELLVQDHEAVDLARAKLGVRGEVRVDFLHAFAH